MTIKPYHHGDLKNALIEAGIEHIGERGINQFSLRKVAERCGVSHTATYAHFKDSDALLQAMSDHISNQFAETLEAVIEGQDICADTLNNLGHAYIDFFIEHPNYFSFLFYLPGVKIDLDHENIDDYPPFVLFRNLAFRLYDKLGLPNAMQKQMLVFNWAQVHGIAALASNKNIKYSGDWMPVLDSGAIMKC